MTFEHEDFEQKFGNRMYFDPTLDLIHECFGYMDLKNGSFFILTGDDGSYVQCAGAKRKLIIEYRKINTFFSKHFVLGLDKDDKTEGYVNYSSGCIRLQKNEILTIDHALLVFDYFYKEKTVPEGYLLRELNKDFT